MISLRVVDDPNVQLGTCVLEREFCPGVLIYLDSEIKKKRQGDVLQSPHFFIFSIFCGDVAWGTPVDQLFEKLFSGSMVAEVVATLPSEILYESLRAFSVRILWNIIEKDRIPVSVEIGKGEDWI